MLSSVAVVTHDTIQQQLTRRESEAVHGCLLGPLIRTKFAPNKLSERENGP
jgi:hypothetical protein